MWIINLERREEISLNQNVQPELIEKSRTLRTLNIKIHVICYYNSYKKCKAQASSSMTFFISLDKSFQMRKFSTYSMQIILKAMYVFDWQEAMVSSMLSPGFWQEL